MKITKIIALLLISILTFSCSSDDDEDGVTTSIDGTWKMTSFLSETAFDINQDGTSSNDVIVDTGCYQNETFTLNTDNTGTVNSTSYADFYLELVIGTTDEYEYTFECVLEDDSYEITWSQDGNSITVLEGGVPSLTGVLSGNTITFVIPNGYFTEIVENGVIVEVTEDLTIIYTKQ